MPTERLSARDFWAAVALGLGFVALYLGTPQARIYGDGIWLVQFLPPPERPMPHHALFTPLYVVLKTLLPDLPRIDAARAICQLSGGGAMGLSYLVARAFGASRAHAAAAVLFFGVSPVAWFFSTQIEFHAVYLFFLALAACVCLLGPWRRAPLVALLLSALALVPVFPAHQMVVLLGPGWVFLARFARVRAGGERPSWPRTLFLVGPVLLAGLVAGKLLDVWLRGGASVGVTGEVDVLSTFLKWGHPITTAIDGWVRPLVLLLPLGIAGFLAFREERDAYLALAVLLGVPLAFYLGVYNAPERGGFCLAPSVFVVACAARALARWRVPSWVVGALVLLQAGAAWHYRMGFDYGFDPERRAELVREALGTRGPRMVFSGHALAPPISFYLPGVEETSLERHALAASEKGLDPELYPLRLAKLDLDELGVVIDLNYSKVPDFEEFDTFPEFRERFEVQLAPYYAALARYVEREFETTLFDDPYWPLLRLDRRREAR